MSKTLQYLSQTANYLKVPPGKITLDPFSLPVRSYNNTTVTGFLNIILVYLEESNRELLGKTAEDKAEVYQWMEYGLGYVQQRNVPQVISDLLPGLNKVLESRTYLAANMFTIADVILYYMLLSVMENMSHLEKEKFANVSRWYDNLQQDENLRQRNSLINFGTLFLLTVEPARH